MKESSSNDLLYLKAVPHDWLLPRCKAVIHQGGARTTAAGLRAGIPNVVIPFMGDQPFWGKRVYGIGVGPNPIPVKNLSVEKLTRAFVEAESESLCKGAYSIGQQLGNEDRAGEAVKWLGKYSNNFHTQH